MLIEIPLTNNIANQTFNILLNDQNVTFELYTIIPTIQNNAITMLYANVYIDNDIIISATRCINLSYMNLYLTPLIGNLFWYCEDGLDPTYDRLNVCHLLYTTDDSLEVYYEKWLAANLTALHNRIGY